MRNRKKIIRACTVPMSIGFFKEVMQKMRADGYESVVVTSPDKELDEFKAECPEFKTIAVPMERHISIKNGIVSLFRMVKVFMRERPYVVHSMTPKAGLICMMAAWLTRVPVRIHTFTGLVWPTAVGTKRKILMLTDKILCACATHIIPEGEGVKNDLQAHITKKPMKVLGYGNCRGVDMERFNPNRPELFSIEHETHGTHGKDADASSLNTNNSNDTNMKTFVFLFVGRIVGDKGINELVEAFTKLNDKYSKTRLVLVGPYEETLDPIKDITKNRIASNNSIMAVGSKYGDDLIREYATADCFVFPSYREGFPNTPLEAGAMGLPQIVTDINGSREIITSYKNENENKNGLKICDNGIIIPSKDAEALYEAMKMMVESCESEDEGLRIKDGRSLYQVMAENARPMIESRFEKNFVQGCQIDFYKEILK